MIDAADSGWRIRPMQSEDLAAVVEIDGTAAPAWSRSLFEAELAQPGGINSIVRLLASDLIVAFVCCRWMADEAEILKIGVRPEWRRRSIGCRLLSHALTRMQELGVSQCFLEVRASNTAARGLYAQQGFAVVGVRKRYYGNQGEDGVIMRRDIAANGAPAVSCWETSA